LNPSKRNGETALTHQARWRWAAIVLSLGLLGIFASLHFRTSAIKPTSSLASSLGSTTAQTSVRPDADLPTLASSAPVSAPQSDLSKDDYSKGRKAYDDFMGALSRLAKATSYRRVLRSKGSNGTYTDTTAYYKRSSNGTDLYREEIRTIDPSGIRAPRLLAVEITNDQGTFYAPSNFGGPQTVFLLTGEADPEARYRQSVLTSVSEDPGTVDMLNYSETANVAPDGSQESLVNITTISQPGSTGANDSPSSLADIQIRLNKATGNIDSQAFYNSAGVAFSTVEFPSLDINPQLDDALFSIPSSIPVVPVTNRVEANQRASELVSHPGT
jgi:outer membrane lipoprotein-sorting protein